MSAYQLLNASRDTDRLHQEVERFLGCGRVKREQGRAAAHSVYLGQDENNYYVEALTAGLDPTTLSITHEEQTLKVSGKRAASKAEEKVVRHIRRERQSGELSFQMRVPSQVDADKISASYQNGILLITLPKAEAVKPRTISVNVQ